MKFLVLIAIALAGAATPNMGRPGTVKGGGAGTRIYGVGIEHVTQHEIVNLPRTSTRERLMKEIWWRVFGEVNLQFFT